MVTFKDKLKELRIEYELSQKELAEKLSVSQRSVSNWENGEREPDFEMLTAIAKFFNVTTDYLLGISE